MDVVTVVLEAARPPDFTNRSRHCGVKLECLGDLFGAVIRAAVDVDPQQLRAPQPAWSFRKVVELVDAIAVEKDGAQCRPLTMRLYAVPQVREP